MTLDEYARHDGLGLAELVRRGDVTPMELVAAAQRALTVVNPKINAVIGAIEATLPEAPRTAPFYGVPFLVKDLVLQAQGVPCDMGSRWVQGALVSPMDSDLMARFRAAGLVTIGRTNTPEFGYCVTTEPVLHGPTRNPWDLSRSPGGSSGGSAAAVAAGIVPLAHASDGGGSIRIPAAHCGLVGLKPTRGRTPVGPEIGMPLHDLGIEHVVTRTLRDCAAALDAIEGPSPGDRYTIARPQRAYLDELQRPPQALRIAFHADGASRSEVSPECALAVEAVAKQCESLGHKVEPARPEYDARALDDVNLCYWASFLVGSIHRLAQVIGRMPSMDNLEAGVWASYQHGLTLRAEDLEQADMLANRISRSVASFFQEFDVLLTPVAAAPPFPLGTLDCNRTGLTATGWLDEVFTHMPFTALFNLTGQPAMSLPLVTSVEGLPLGVQLVARYGDEATLFRLAGQLEAAMPWSQRRPPVHVSGADHRA